MCIYSTRSRSNQARIWFHKSLSKANSPIKCFSLFCLIEIHLNINNNEWVYSHAVQYRPTATINHLVNMNNNFNHSELRRRAHKMNCILWMSIWVWVQLSAAANECECLRVSISVFTWQSLLFYCDLLAKTERERERVINAEQQSAQQEQQQKISTWENLWAIAIAMWQRVELGCCGCGTAALRQWAEPAKLLCGARMRHVWQSGRAGGGNRQVQQQQPRKWKFIVRKWRKDSSVS